MLHRQRRVLQDAKLEGIGFRLRNGRGRRDRWPEAVGLHGGVVELERLLAHKRLSARRLGGGKCARDQDAEDQIVLHRLHTTKRHLIHISMAEPIHARSSWIWQS